MKTICYAIGLITDRVPRARTTLDQESFLPSTTRAFNDVSLSIRNAPSVSSFKRQLFSTSNNVPQYFYFGKRRYQILHTRLRTNCTSLSDALFIKNIVPSPLCTCGQREKVAHCQMYNAVRAIMINTINQYCRVSLSTILFGNASLSDVMNENIFLAVLNYIEKSKRFD